MQILHSLKWFAICFIIVVLLVAALFWLYLNIEASMHVSARNADIQLSHSLPVKIEVGNYLEVQSVGTLNTKIDLDHHVDLPIKGKYLADLSFSVEVPVQVAVDYQTDVLIDQTMPLSTTTDLVYQNKFLPKFPLNIDIPVKLSVPFHLKQTYTIPIKIDFSGPVYLELDEKVRLHVLHQFAPKLNINDPMTMRKIATFNATMFNTERNSKANLDMQMTLPLKNIHP